MVRRKDYSYVSNLNAKRLLKINEKSSHEDAIGWAIPSGSRNNKRLYIMDENILHLLDFEEAIDYTIGNVDFENVLNQIYREKRLNDFVDTDLEN